LRQALADLRSVRWRRPIESLRRETCPTRPRTIGLRVAPRLREWPCDRRNLKSYRRNRKSGGQKSDWLSAERRRSRFTSRNLDCKRSRVALKLSNPQRVIEERLALRPYPPMVCFDDLAGDLQSESGTWDVAGRIQDRRSAKAPEDLLKVLVWD